MSRTMSVMRVHIRTCVCSIPTYFPIFVLITVSVGCCQFPVFGVFFELVVEAK